MAPIQYLNRFRMEQAKRFLSDTNRPVTEIARLVGIPDPNYFARFFRKLTGTSPQSYRKGAAGFSPKVRHSSFV